MDVGTPVGGLGASFQLGSCTNTNLHGSTQDQFSNNCGVEVGPGDGSTTSGTILFPAGTSGTWAINYAWGGGSTAAGGAVIPVGVQLTSSINIDTDTLSSLNVPYNGAAGNGLAGTAPTQSRCEATYYVIMGDSRLPCVFSFNYTTSYTLPAAPCTCSLIITQVPDDIGGIVGAVEEEDEKKMSFEEMVRVSEPDDEKDGDMIDVVTPAAASTASVMPSSEATRLRDMIAGREPYGDPKWRVFALGKMKQKELSLKISKK